MSFVARELHYRNVIHRDLNTNAILLNNISVYLLYESSIPSPLVPLLFPSDAISGNQCVVVTVQPNVQLFEKLHIGGNLKLH